MFILLFTKNVLLKMRSAFVKSGKAVIYSLSVAARAVKNTALRFPRIAKGMVAVALVFVLGFAAISVTGACSAYEVSLDGVAVGCVSTVDEINSAKDIAKEQVLDEEGKNEIEKAEYTTVLTAANHLNSPEVIAENLLNNSETINLVCTVMKGEDIIAYAHSTEDANNIINKYLQDKKAMLLVDEVSLSPDIQLVENYLSSESLKDIPALSGSVDILPVCSVKYETVAMDIPYPTKKIKSNDMYVGSSKVVKQGVNGSKTVLQKVYYNNEGAETARKNIKETVITEPTPREVLVGNKILVYGYGGVSGEKPNSKGFVWPMDRTVKYHISSYFGDGRNHKGVDICAAKGTKIYASLGGTVELASWSGNYGYCVIIDHGNGLKTRYAHCSKFLVKAGQVVARGQNIALIGSTGRSTGPHVHFEVIINGKAVNPMPYIGGK